MLPAELAAPVIASGHMGYAADGKYASVFEHAWELSKIKRVTQFPPENLNWRHDQPLYTTLAYVYGCPTVPLTDPELGATHVSSRKDGRPWPTIQEARESGRPVYAHRQLAGRDLQMVLGRI